MTESADTIARLRSEFSIAGALAAVKKLRHRFADKEVAAILSGGNLDSALLGEVFS